MLEYFVANKYLGQNVEGFGMDMGMLISYIIAFGAAYLAYMCNMRSSMVVRILSTVLAFLFSGFYLLYYFVWHVLLGRAC